MLHSLSTREQNVACCITEALECVGAVREGETINLPSWIVTVLHPAVSLFVLLVINRKHGGGSAFP